MSKEPIVIASLPASTQTIVLRQDALNHMARYKQTKWWKCEAGGQLFGRLCEGCLQIELATGPYRGDFRSRFGYRSSPATAQREINKQRARGLYYCGDWHTHPEGRPQASAEDLRTLATLVERSDLRLNNLVMVIQGTEAGSKGLSVYSSSGDVPVSWAIADGSVEHA